MRALDLYCKAGGATQGLLEAGFTEVVGIDSEKQPRYIGTHFIQRNVLGLPPSFLEEFDFIWASPPCQAHVSMAHRDTHPDLIAATRFHLNRTDIPWVIENVPSAPLPKFITLCGTMFPFLRVVRHRRFEFSLNAPHVPQPYHIPRDEHPPVYSFDRRKGRMNGLNEDDNYITAAGNNASLGAMADAMGIWWMTRPEIAQAVPPAYAKYIGSYIIKSAISDGPLPYPARV